MPNRTLFKKRFVFLSTNQDCVGGSNNVCLCKADLQSSKTPAEIIIVNKGSQREDRKVNSCKTQCVNN